MQHAQQVVQHLAYIPYDLFRNYLHYNNKQDLTDEIFSAILSGLAGKTSEEEAMSDMLVVAMEDDLLEKYWQFVFFEQDAEKKVNMNDMVEILTPQCLLLNIFPYNQAELRKSFIEEKVPKFLDNIDKLYQKSGGDYLLGNSLSYADLAYYRMINAIKGVVGEDIGSDRLKGLYQRVAALPRIINYEKNKPKTEF